MASKLSLFLAEMKRRRVYRVAVIYVVVGFAVWQAADFAVPALNLPESAASFILLLTLLCFPIALVLAWSFELRPEEATPAAPPATPDTSPDALRVPTCGMALHFGRGRMGAPLFILIGLAFMKLWFVRHRWR